MHYNVPMDSVPLFTARLLRSSSRALANAALARQEQQHPELANLGLPDSFPDPLADTEVRLLQLAEAVGVDRPALFSHALAWYRVAFAHRDVPDGYLPANLAAIAATLEAELPVGGRELVARHIGAATTALARAPRDLPSLVATPAPHVDLARNFLLALLEERGDAGLDLIRDALAQGLPIPDLHDHVLTKVQREIGRMWLMGEIPIADEHYGSLLVGRALDMVQERLPRAAAGAPRVLTMAVGGNLHALGIRVIAQRFQLDGWQVVDLGSNMPVEDLAWALTDRPVQLLAMSASMTLHVSAAANAVARLRSAVTACPPILVGGEPFQVVPDLHQCIGADASAVDAAGAVAAGRRLLAMVQR